MFNSLSLWLAVRTSDKGPKTGFCWIGLPRVLFLRSVIYHTPADKVGAMLCQSTRRRPQTPINKSFPAYGMVTSQAFSGYRLLTSLGQNQPAHGKRRTRLSRYLDLPGTVFCPPATTSRRHRIDNDLSVDLECNEEEEDGEVAVVGWRCLECCCHGTYDMALTFRLKSVWQYLQFTCCD